MQKPGSPLKSKSLQYMCDYNIQKDQGQHIFQRFSTGNCENVFSSTSKYCRLLPLHKFNIYII